MSRKLLCLMSFVLVLVLAGNATAQIDPATVTDGHVYFPGGASGGVVPDSTAVGHTASVVGEPQVVDIPGGRGLQFDGVDDGVHIPDSQFINVTGGPFPNRTVLAVFNCADVTKAEKQVVFEEGGLTRGLVIYVLEGQVYVGGWNKADYDPQWNPGSWISTPIGSNEWHAVALVIRDGAPMQEDDKFEMWMDGVLIGKAPGAEIWNHGNDNAIGFTDQNVVFHDGNGSGDGWYFQGIVSEVWILNQALTEAELAPLMAGPQPSGEPLFLEPIDGTEVTETTAMLSWRNSDLATEHNVYMGTNADEVAAGTVPAVAATMDSILAGSAGGPIPDGLAPDTTYYWRVEAVNPDDPNSPWTSTVNSLWLRPELATLPSPADGTINHLPAAVDISWRPGFAAIMQTVALGTDPAALVPGPPLMVDMPYDTPALEVDTTYYWQISTFDGITWKPGPVWSFSTLPAKVADVTDPNLIGWWKFDEGPLSASVLDYSGNDHHGTLHGDPQPVPGYDGGAFDFDGSGDYVSLDGYPGVLGPKPFSITAWINTSATSGTLMGWGSTGGGTTRFEFRPDADELRAESSGNVQGLTKLPDNEWIHVAVTVKENAIITEPDVTLYLNGQVDNDPATGGTAPLEMEAGDNVATIARRHTSGRFFAALIDDMRLYDKELSQDEIKQIMRTDLLEAWDPQPNTFTTTDILLVQLAWQAGDGAVEHDVYLGTDADAVAAGDASVSRGRQAETSYVIPEKLEFETAYYWRIDEVAADGTVTAGRVWTFETDPELVLYDTETPFEYDTGGTRDISLELGAALDWTEPIGRLAVNYTGAPAPGSVTVDEAAGTTMIVGRGADIWGTADEFQYAYTTLTGNGSMTVKVDSLAHTDNWTKAGIMIRETLDAGSSFAAVFATGTNGVRFQARAMTDQPAESDTPVATDEQKALTPPVWIKIERTFPMVNAYYSTDGVTFVPMSWNPQVIPMSPAPIYIGLAMTSHSGAETYAEAVFSELSSDGGVAPGPLTSAEIGLTGNAAEPMYLVLEDASGASSAVMNPDPAATQQTSATDFIVELADFGIDLTAVTKVTLVIGDLDAPAPGGSGSLTIHDVRLLKKLPLIVWVSDFYDDNGDGVSDDESWIPLLEAEGYKVDYTPGASPGDGYWRTLDDGKIAALNAADLIIVSRNSNSGDYDDGDEPAQWNAVTTPIILSSTHIVRSSRWRWLDTTSISSVDATMEVLADDPIFAGVAVAGDMVDAQDPAVGPISFINTVDPGNGTVLAKVADADASWIIAWDAGVEYYAGSGETAGGARMFFGAGTQESGGTIGRGELNLTADGQAIFLNAVSELIGN